MSRLYPNGYTPWCKSTKPLFISAACRNPIAFDRLAERTPTNSKLGLGYHRPIACVPAAFLGFSIPLVVSARARTNLLPASRVLRPPCSNLCSSIASAKIFLTRRYWKTPRGKVTSSSSAATSHLQGLSEGMAQDPARLSYGTARISAEKLVKART
ncbi:hypothetical protein N431DRAFT_464490 [Stipitochalara longipes BDJ]|nr:hypothetical protein N431DRAFT_464490 [Stipitochalara longipes BDJ]